MFTCLMHSRQDHRTCTMFSGVRIQDSRRCGSAVPVATHPVVAPTLSSYTLAKQYQVRDVMQLHLYCHAYQASAAYRLLLAVLPPRNCTIRDIGLGQCQVVVWRRADVLPCICTHTGVSMCTLVSYAASGVHTACTAPLSTHHSSCAVPHTCRRMLPLRTQHPFKTPL